MAAMTAQQRAACEAHWAQVRRGISIEEAGHRASRETRPGHRLIRRLRWAAIVMDLPDRQKHDALHIRKHLGDIDWAKVRQKARSDMAYGRKL